MKKILLLILVITSNPVFSDETFGDWEVSQMSDNTAFYASPSSKGTDEVMLVLYFFKQDECDVTVTALIPTDEEEDIEAHSKDKKMLLTVDGDFYWGADKVLVSRKNNTVWVQLYTNKDSELISELKKGRKLELKIGTMPIIEYSLMGAYKAIAATERRCGVALGAEDLLK